MQANFFDVIRSEERRKHFSPFPCNEESDWIRSAVLRRCDAMRCGSVSELETTVRCVRPEMVKSRFPSVPGDGCIGCVGEA